VKQSEHDMPQSIQQHTASVFFSLWYVEVLPVHSQKPNLISNIELAALQNVLPGYILKIFFPSITYCFHTKTHSSPKAFLGYTHTLHMINLTDIS
jgi:hypothetical protein